MCTHVFQTSLIHHISALEYLMLLSPMIDMLFQEDWVAAMYKVNLMEGN